MLKKGFATLVFLACMSALCSWAASAYQLQTKLSNTGGTVRVRNNALQTTAGSTVFTNFTTSKAIPVTVAPLGGYKIAALTRNGVSQMGFTNHSTGFTTNYLKSDGSVQSLAVSFTQKQLAVGTGAGISPTNPAAVFGGSKVFTITPPGTSNVIQSVSLSVPAAATVAVTDISGNPVTLPFAGAIKVTLTNITNSVSLAAVFSRDSRLEMWNNCTVACHAGAGSASVQAVYGTWEASKHQAVNVDCITCHNTMPGPIGKGSVDRATFKVTAAAAGTVGSYYCARCHNQDIMTGFDGSLHKTNSVTCTSCHTQGSHNPAVSASPCDSCHVKNGVVANHPFAIGTAACISCHNPHSTVGTVVVGAANVHYNNITSGMYPASFVTSKASCADCHFTSAANLAVRQQWYTSGHARVTDTPWSAYDFKTRAGCVQCHTTTGFIAYSTGKVTAAWGVDSDKTKEVLTCVGCHKDITTGELRTVTPVQPYADDSYTNRNVGESNLCMDCHSGRNNGNSILVKVGTADFAVQPFIAPHYLAAAGTLHGKAGYHFPGQTYAFYSSNSHRAIGMANNNGTGSAGPCVACHKNSTNGHTFAAGAIALCSNCHGSSMPAAQLASNQAAFANALVVLKAMLKDQGYVYTAQYPYFSNTSWGTSQMTDQGRANIMGAAYNYLMLVKEPGAYAHNSAYAKELIVDSIDAVYNNGSVTGSIDNALSYLVGKGAISADAAASLASYKSGSSCTSCHVASTGSHFAHLDAEISCSACHSTTAASNSTLVPGTATHANGVVNVAIAGAGSYSGGLAGTCSGVYCHSNGQGTSQNPAPAWGGAKLTCKSCHPTLGGAHAAHVGDLLNSVTFYNYTGNYSTGAAYRFGCANCHPTSASSHRDGKVDVTLARDPSAGTLRNMNDAALADTGIGNTGSGITGTTKLSVVCSAAYCHSNGVADNLVFASSPNWYATSFTGDRCAMCHGNSPNSTIAGSSAHTVHVVGIHSLNVYSGGFGNLSTASTGNVGHGIAAQSTTLNCNTCHNDTVTSSRNDNGNACSGCHSNQGNALQIANKSMHVNGRVDISFANISVVSKAQLRPASFAAYTASSWTRNGGNYKNGAAAFDTSKTTLRNAAGFDGGNCSNVVCHMGKPVNWTKDTNSPSYCALCHTAL